MAVVKRKYAYDPWGARRNASNWTQNDNGSNLIISRGYTGHEHIDAFGIINMNGRVYDPTTAMFFSPDPFIQSPGDWSNYNRYSYVSNNPTKYIDPSGYQLANLEMPKMTDLFYRLNGIDRQFGSSGGGGIFSGKSIWDGFIYARVNGWTGNYTDFLGVYDKQSTKPNFNGTITVHTWFNVSLKNEMGVVSTIASAINVKVGGGMNGGKEFSGGNGGLIESVSDFFSGIYEKYLGPTDYEKLYSEEERKGISANAKYSTEAAGVFFSAGALSRFAPKPIKGLSIAFTSINTYSSYETIISDPNRHFFNYLDFGVGTLDLVVATKLMRIPYVSTGAVIYSFGRIGYDLISPSLQSSLYYFDNSSMTMRKKNW